MSDLELGQAIHQLFTARSIVEHYEAKLDRMIEENPDPEQFDSPLFQEFNEVKAMAGAIARTIKPHVVSLEDRDLAKHKAYREYLRSLKEFEK